MIHPRTIGILGHTVTLILLSVAYTSCVVDTTGSVAVKIIGILAFVAAFAVLFRLIALIAGAIK